MKNWKSILLLALVFVAGAAVGVVGTRAAVRRFVEQVITQPEKFQAFVERDLSRKLRLDEGQRVKLHGILSDTRGQLKGLRQQYRPQAGLVISNADAQITALLTPAQQARYEKFKESNHPVWRVLRQEP
jgi:hypothetical protein